MEHRAEQQRPIYTEHFDTKKEMRIFALAIVTLAIISLALLSLVPKTNLLNGVVFVSIVLGVALIAFSIYFPQRDMAVEYTPEAIRILRNGSVLRVIPLQEIESIRLGTYRTGKGAAFAQEDGSKTTMRHADILVWNIRTSWQTNQQLILKMKSQDKLLVLHAQNRDHVLSLLASTLST